MSKKPLYKRPFKEGESHNWSANTIPIWHPDECIYFEPTKNSYCYFRREFWIDSMTKTADIRLFVDGNYILYINGQYVGRGPCRSDPHWQYYDKRDISKFLNRGSNAIGLFCLYYGYGTGQHIPRSPALYLQVDVKQDDERQITIPSDGNWKVLASPAHIRDVPRINGRQGPIEIFDKRQEPKGWAEPDYKDDDWVSAGRQSIPMKGTNTGPYWNLILRDIPFLKETTVNASRIIAKGVVEDQFQPDDKIHVQLLKEVPDWTHREPFSIRNFLLRPCENHISHVIMVDFGQVQAGYFQLEVDSLASGAIIDVVYGEELWEGNICLSPADRPVDRFILQEGMNKVEVAFGWKAFRYVQLTIRNKNAQVLIERIGLRTRNYPVTKKEPFRCSDDQMNKILDISTHTLGMCMQDGYIDSPSREQQQWIGDGRWQAINNYYTYGDALLHRKMLKQIGQSQDYSGMICPRYPDGHKNTSPIPSYCAAWISSFWEYYIYTGDDSLFYDLWPNILQAIRWFTAYENSDGLIENVPHWPFIDWGESWGGSCEAKKLDVERGGVVTPLNLMYLEALQNAAKIAEHIGDKESLDIFEGRSNRVMLAIKNLLWNGERGAYVDCSTNGILSKTISQPTNALALLYLHKPGDNRAEAIVRNVFDINHGVKDDAKHNINHGVNDDVIKGSPYFLAYICRALTWVQKPNVALEFIRQQYAPLIELGATSTWETWELFHIGPGGGTSIASASHGWGASTNIFFAETILGVSPIKPGFDEFLVQPQLCDLKYASGCVPTTRGDILMEVKKQPNNMLKLHISIPKGTVAIIANKRIHEGEHKLCF